MGVEWGRSNRENVTHLLVGEGEERGGVGPSPVAVKDDVAVLEQLEVERDGVGGVVGADGAVVGVVGPPHLGRCLSVLFSRYVDNFFRKPYS